MIYASTFLPYHSSQNSVALRNQNSSIRVHTLTYLGNYIEPKSILGIDYNDHVVEDEDDDMGQGDARGLGPQKLQALRS